MNEYNIKVDFTKGRIVTDLKKLVQNDYNSTKINFTFEKEGRVLFKMLYPDGSEYVDEVQNNELIFGKGILNQEGTYEYEISLYSENGRLTDHAIKDFEVRSELVDTDELVAPDDRVPILDTLINEVNTIKQDVADGKYNGENGTDGQDGITPTIGDNGNWYLGDTDTGLPSKGEKGNAGSVKFIVVTQLPIENIDESAIYMKPVADPQGENTYQEYIYVNGAWETLGTASVEVDLSNYPTKEEVKAITGELENLPTEDKSNIVNSIIELASNSGGGNSIYYEIELPINKNSSPTYINTEDDKNKVSELINKIYQNRDADPKLFVTSPDKQTKQDFVFSNVPYNLAEQTQYKFFGFKLDGLNSVKTMSSLRYLEVNLYTITINGKWINGVFTATNGTIMYGSTSNKMINFQKLLFTDNTTAFNPTADYHPATKKYVDDAIAALKAELSGS